MKRTPQSLLLLALSSLFAAQLAAVDLSEQAIIERIKPVGEVYIDGQVELIEVSNTASANATRSGEQVYNTACASCHASGVLGAPMRGDNQAWSQRFEKGEEGVFNNAWNGIGAMPAKGLCMDCSEEEMRAAIAYLSQ